MKSIIGQILRCLLSEYGKEKDWERLLPIEEVIINPSSNSTIGYTPVLFNCEFNSIAPIELLSGDEALNVEVVQHF